jgi:hypothetical protein
MRGRIMPTFAPTAAIAALLAALSFHVPTANAAVLYVLLIGTDSPSCGSFPSPFNPCRTLQQAVTNAAAGDTIFLDVAVDYGPATINKSVNILSRSIGAGTYSPAAKPCLTITGTNTVVRLSRYTCDQGGAAQPGIKFSGKSLQLDDVTVRGGTGAVCGVLVQSAIAATISMQNSLIHQFGTSGSGGGVCLTPASGGNVKGSLSNVTLQSNRNGVVATATATSSVQIVLADTRVSEASAAGLRSSGATAKIMVRDSIIARNAIGLLRVSSGNLTSLSGNIVADNTTKGTFTSTVPQQ